MVTPGGKPRTDRWYEQKVAGKKNETAVISHKLVLVRHATNRAHGMNLMWYYMLSLQLTPDVQPYTLLLLLFALSFVVLKIWIHTVKTRTLPFYIFSLPSYCTFRVVYESEGGSTVSFNTVSTSELVSWWKTTSPFSFFVSVANSTKNWIHQLASKHNFVVQEGTHASQVIMWCYPWFC